MEEKGRSRPWSVWAASLYLVMTAVLAGIATYRFLANEAHALAGVSAGIFVVIVLATWQMLFRPTPWARRHAALLLGLMGMIGLGASLMSVQEAGTAWWSELGRAALSLFVLGLYSVFSFGPRTRRYFGSPARMGRSIR